MKEKLSRKKWRKFHTKLTGRRIKVISDAHVYVHPGKIFDLADGGIDRLEGQGKRGGTGERHFDGSSPV
jgi:hypothetical protein